VDDCLRRGATDVSLSAEGATIVARDDAGAWDPGTGQQWLDWSSRLTDAVARLPRVGDRDLPAAAGPDVSRVAADRAPRRCDALNRTTIERDTDDGVAMLELGRERHEAGDAREAARLYESAVPLVEAALAVTAWFNLGVAREDLGDSHGALRAYRAALTLDPSCADAHYNAARLCELAGDQVGALRHLRAYSTCPFR
jgi:tetratricopeptide (TPR) repeat protein